jgi:hypothetical protein
LLVQYDAMQPGQVRDALALTIDAVAAQRYATRSRLYWYTDLEAAKAAATSAGKPILSLRMLGRLDEDMSCANSRYFRVALYANRELSAMLRERFVLHWSSERPVPRITLDFGDGRKLERTLAGNSAHYVLDAAGRPIDALPGLYAPAVFGAELAKSLALVAALDGKTGDARTRLVVEHHQSRLAERDREWAKLDKVLVSSSNIALPASAPFDRTLYPKSGGERPVYRVVDLGIDVDRTPEQMRAWAQVGLRLAAPASVANPAPGSKLSEQAAQTGALPPLPILEETILDDSSRALIRELQPPTQDRYERDYAAFTFAVALLADTALNELRYRRWIRERLISAPNVDFESLNRQIYSSLFKTPADDPWLGLDGGGFLALPNGGMTAP